MTVQPTGTALATPTFPLGADQLTDVANVVSMNDPHLYHGGSYESSGLCGTGVLVAGTDPCTQQDLLQSIDPVMWTEGYPGLVITGASCLGAVDLTTLQASALRNVEARVNRTIQDNIVGGLIPTSEFDDRPLTGNDSLAVAAQIARCEYLGQAVIHVNPVLAAPYMGKEIIRVGRHLETVGGSMISLSCGMAEDELAITGALTVYKGANRVLDPMPVRAVGGQITNQWFVSVQTPVTVFADCGLLVLITSI